LAPKKLIVTIFIGLKSIPQLVYQKNTRFALFDNSIFGINSICKLIVTIYKKKKLFICY